MATRPGCWIGATRVAWRRWRFSGRSIADTIAALFEARRLLLVEAARLACERRSAEQADQLCELAGTMQSAEEDSVALLADWSYMSTLVQAAGNLILQLIMNSVRELYLPSIDGSRRWCPNGRGWPRCTNAPPRRSLTGTRTRPLRRSPR